MFQYIIMAGFFPGRDLVFRAPLYFGHFVLLSVLRFPGKKPAIILKPGFLWVARGIAEFFPREARGKKNGPDFIVR